jgi:hypothetical protein
MTAHRDHAEVRVVLACPTDEQGRSGYSIPDQRRVLEEHAGREGWSVVETVVDDGYSAATRTAPACGA